MNVTMQMVLDVLAPFAPAAVGNHSIPSGFDTVNLFPVSDGEYQATTLYVASGQAMDHFFSAGGPDPLPQIGVICVADSSWMPSAASAFPLVLISDTAAFSPVFNRIQDLFYRVAQWEMELNRTMYAGGTLQDMLDVGEPMFSNPLLLWDVTFNILAYSRHLHFENAFMKKLFEKRVFANELIQRIVSQGQLAMPEHQNSLRILHNTKSGSPYYIRHYFLNGHRSYSLAMASVNGMPSDGEVDLLQYFCSKVGEYLDRQVEQGRDSYNLYEAFLQNLLDGKLVEEQEIAERASALGISINQGYLIYYIEFEHFSKSQAEFLIHSLRQTLPRERFIIRAESVCLLKSVDAYSCDKEEARARFTHLLTTYHAHCGLSKAFQSLTECRAAYTQACAALRLGRRVNSAKDAEAVCHRIFLYKDYAIYHMLELYEKDNDLFSLLPKRLAAFYESERKSGGNDIELLSVFMETGMSMIATAQACFLHRNSVAYRIKRIEERLKLDFSNMESVMNVLLLLNIIRYWDGGQ